MYIYENAVPNSKRAIPIEYLTAIIFILRAKIVANVTIITIVSKMATLFVIRIP